MRKLRIASITIGSILLLSSCSNIGDEFGRNIAVETASGIDVISSSTANDGSTLVDFRRAEIASLEEEIAILEQELDVERMTNESILASAELLRDKHTSDVLLLEENIEELQSDMAILSREFQAYRNEVESFLAESDLDINLVDSHFSETESVNLYEDVSVEELRASEDLYYMEKIQLTGQITEIREGTALDYLVLTSENGEGSCVVLEMSKELKGKHGLKVDDKIRVFGISYGMVQTKSMDAEDMLCPGIYVDLIVDLD